MELKSQKKIYFYFKKGILNDNKGWIMNDFYDKELIGLDRQRLDFRDGYDDFRQNTFYEINLYFDRILEYHTRTYQKIQDVIAGVGGLLKVITFVFGNLTIYYNEHYFYLDLINNVLLKNNSNNGKNDLSYRSKFEYTINKLNNNINNSNLINLDNNNNRNNKDHNFNHEKLNIDNNNNLNNSNIKRDINNNNLNNINDNLNSNNLNNNDLNSNNIILNNSNYINNSYLDLNKSQPNSNLNYVQPVSSNSNQEQNNTIRHNQKSSNNESKFKKIRSISVFKKINDEKIQNVNSQLKNLDISGNIIKESNNVNQGEFQCLKPNTKVSISFMGYICYCIFKKMKKKRNENFYNFQKYAELTDKYIDVEKILEFFSRYEPLLDQLAMSADSNSFNNNMILNN